MIDQNNRISNTRYTYSVIKEIIYPFLIESSFPLLRNPYSSYRAMPDCNSIRAMRNTFNVQLKTAFLKQFF